MNFPLTPSLGKLPATILLCVALAACSSMQKSSTGTGTQEAVPISEAGKTDAGTSSPGTGTPGSSPVTTTTAPSGTTSAAPTATTPGKGDEESERLRKQLADQEAEINRMRDDQVNSQRLADEEAARRQSSEAAAATGSSSQQQSAAAGPGQSQPSSGAPAGSQSAAAAAAAGTSGAESASGSDAPMAGQPLQRSVYFDYDASTIADQYDSMLVGHAAFLKAHPDFDVEVQGNCDDRGSREYNIALGARRAEAVKRALELAGADGTRIKAVSFGAEKPVAFGQDEESYRQNRRADIQY